jgi:hypothetical protein
MLSLVNWHIVVADACLLDSSPPPCAGESVPVKESLASVPAWQRARRSSLVGQPGATAAIQALARVAARRFCRALEPFRVPRLASASRREIGSLPETSPRRETKREETSTLLSLHFPAAKGSRCCVRSRERLRVVLQSQSTLAEHDKVAVHACLVKGHGCTSWHRPWPAGQPCR